MILISIAIDQTQAQNPKFKKKGQQKMKKAKKTDLNRDAITIRLDALLRLILEFSKNKEGLTDGAAAQILKSVGLTPTEIAKIFGKKSATDVAPYLYKKGKTE